MEDSKEQLQSTDKFEIRSIIEQKPFRDPAVQAFFSIWCKINDSIKLEVVTREEWEEKLKCQKILEGESDDKKKKLYVPKDLQLWEMIGVIEAIDRDTFAKKPEIAKQKKEKIISLGETFKNAGVYLAKRLNEIEEGREIAEALALEFYQYGELLTQGKTQQIPEVDIKDIASKELSLKDTEKIDRFLAGETLYESRMKRVEKLAANDPTKINELKEEERKKTLAQFFRVAKKAFELERKSVEQKLQKSKKELKPWQSNTPIHSAFLRRIERALTRRIETPKQELIMSVFRRGLEKLVNETRERGWRHAINSFFKILGLDLQLKQRRIFEMLNIPQMKADLEVVRQKGDPARIAAKEREIADKIQKAVSRFPYNVDSNNPSEMVANQYINCVGASMLGGGLMKETGLTYLVGSVPNHSILFLVTADGQVEWRDMLDSSFNEPLTNEMIKGQRKDGKPLTVKDIVVFSKNPSPEGLMFEIDTSMCRREKIPWVKKGQSFYMAIFEPEYGQKIQLLNNTGIVLFKNKLYKVAVKAYQEVISLNPNDAYFYNNLGIAFRRLGHQEEAVKAYQKAISLNPNDARFYKNLGTAFLSLNRQKEAIETYEKFLALADKNVYANSIRQVEEIITELKKNTERFQ